MCNIGIGVAPHILNYLEKSGADDMKAAFLISVAESVLCIDTFEIWLKYHEEYGADFGTPQKDLINIKRLLNEAAEKVPQIINSDKATADKQKELKFYGVAALPYISQESMEFQTIAKELGLLLSVERRMEMQIESGKDKVDYTSVPEEFNVKDWLSENKYDLNILKSSAE